jgi:signal transduction histidine kinase
VDAQVQLSNLNPAILLPPSAEAVLGLAESAAADPEAAFSWPVCPTDPGLWLSAMTLCQDESPPNALTLLDHFLAHTPLALADWTRSRAAQRWQVAQLAVALARHAASSNGLASQPLVALTLATLVGEFVQAHLPEPVTLSADSLRRYLARRWRWPTWLQRSLMQVDLPIRAVVLPADEQRLVLLVRAVCHELARRFPRDHWPRWFAEDSPSRLDCGFESVAAPDSVPPAAPQGGAAAVFERHLRLTRRLLVGSPWKATDPWSAAETEAESLRRQLSALAQTQEADLRDEKLIALAEFAAGASHEINNPLAVISGQAQHLLRDEEDLERAVALRRIVRQRQRIHQVLRDVMFFARPPQPQFQTVRLERIVKAIFAALTPLAGQRGVTLEAGPGLRQRLTADPELLQAALTCLVQNGIEASPQGGWVRVSAAISADHEIAISVADAGPGLSPELIRHIFDPFFSGRHAGRGMGMGLPKVWRVAQLHDGNIVVASPPGQSAVFVLKLPLKKSHLAIPSRYAARHSRAGSRPARRRRRSA